MNRFDRIAAILVQLQARRVVRGPALAAQFEVALRTIYRDLHTLAQAGVPLCGEPGVGYSLAEGYRLPPVMFTREEATALLTAEKLAAGLTDDHTARLSAAAMDKLRAVLRQPDRDYLEDLSPHIQVLRRAPLPPAPGGADAHQRLLAAIATARVVRLQYHDGAGAATERDVEPIGLYLGQHWHAVAYCRLRQEFRDFRLDRIEQLQVLDVAFAPRTETLQHYWQAQAARHPQELAVVRFGPAAARHVEDAKHQHGWLHEETTPDGGAVMTLRVTCLRYLASWLLPYAGQVRVASPPALRTHLHELARAAHEAFCATE